MIEQWVITTPNVSLQHAATRWGVDYASVKRHGGESNGNWLEKQKAHFIEKAWHRDEQYDEILGNNGTDDVVGFVALEKQLRKATLSALHLLFPPADAPVEAQMAAAERLQKLNASQLSRIVSDGVRGLTEMGRHKRLLRGEATAIFARAGTDDAYIPEDPELARMLEERSRRAQQMLLEAQSAGAIDVDFAVSPSDSPTVSHSPSNSPDREIPPTASNSPRNADSPDPDRDSAVSPGSLDAQDTGVGLHCVTSRGTPAGHGRVDEETPADVGI